MTSSHGTQACGWQALLAYSLHPRALILENTAWSCWHVKTLEHLCVLSVSDSEKYILTNSMWQYLLKYILGHTREMQGPFDTKITFFCDVMSCSLVDRYQHFRQILCCWTLSITPSCLFFKIQGFRDWILSLFSRKTYTVGPNWQS